MTNKTQRLDELKRLVGPDTERLKRDNPNLADLLREYREEWKAFREAVGGRSEKTSATPAQGRRYRA